MATSTLELGIDVGDLDRVIQVNDPSTVASFLQRIGRTGRRDGSSRNCLFLALGTGPLLWSAGLLHLWGQGYVEPVMAPPEPRHIVAQQILALCLQEHRIGRNSPPRHGAAFCGDAVFLVRRWWRSPGFTVGQPPGRIQRIAR